MEKKQKPRISYNEFAAVKLGLNPHKIRTVAWVIERFIREMNGYDGKAPVRELGTSHEYILRRLQRMPIGSKMAPDLNKNDVIGHCRMRKDENVLPQTVNQDVTYLRGALKYAGSAWDGCEDISDAAVAAAMPFLNKHQLVSKSVPRDRRPTDEERARLRAYFAEQNQTEQTAIDMVAVSDWQLYSGRRISETCRIEWLGWDPEMQTMIVHKMKDPKNRNKTKIVALPDRANDMLLEMAWAMNADPETWHNQERRIFAYIAKSCGARYTRAKADLGIPNLHLHDSRRECGTRLVEDDGYSPEEAILVTGHETTAIFQRTYLRMKPENFRLGPKARRLAAEKEAA